MPDSILTVGRDPRYVSCDLGAPDPDRGVECRGDLVRFPPGRWDWLHLLFGSADLARAAHGEEVLLHYRDAVDPEWLYPAPGQAWARVPVTRPEVLTAIRLPDRPGLWVVAATLVSPLVEQTTEAS